MEIAIQRGGGIKLIDRTFFAMLDRMLVIANQQGQGEPFMQLRNNLIEMTDVGKEIKAQGEHIRAVLGTINQQTTREDLIDLLLKENEGDHGGEIMATLASAVAPALDYQFLLAVNERFEAATDDALKQKLDDIRQIAMSIQEQQRASQQMMVQQVQQVLQEVLQAEDVDAKLAELADYIDESFLGVLAGNIQAAEQRGSKAAASRLKDIYDRAIKLIESQMPPEMRLVNQLLNADDRAEVSRLLQENRSALTPEFIEALKALEGEMRNNRRVEAADRLKTLRWQIQLMI